jgi:AraC-like DNA-binding protein
MAYDGRGLVEQIRKRLSQRDSTLSALSRALGVERHTIERLISKSTGKTFRELRQQIVFEHAPELLRSGPNQSIKEVAFTVGFSSPGSFTQFCKRTSGKTPLRLRDPAPRILASTPGGPNSEVKLQTKHSFLCKRRPVKQ